MSCTSPPADTSTPRRGLSSGEAQRRRAELGPNALPEKAREPGWQRFVRQFRSPLIYILLFALVLDAVVWLSEGGRGVPLEAAAIAVILLLNAMLGVWQERRAEDALARLKQLAAPSVRVFRDGKLVGIPSRELVPGDVVRLEVGDRIPADGRTVGPMNFAVDESVLTGESIPVHKVEGRELFAGTLAVRGTTDAEITATGKASHLGQLATMLGEVVSEKTPLEKRLVVFGNRVARWILTLSITIAMAGILIEGIGQVGHVLLFAVALAVAAVPEGLPAVLTLTLALGVERMAKRQAVVRRLSAVEALGSVTVIASDKTGTLTENRLEVRGVDSPDPDRAVRAMVLANDAEPGATVGDPLEMAMLRFATREGLDVGAIRSRYPRQSVRPFDSSAKYMRVTVRGPAGEESYLKGAPETILSRCTISPDDRAAWQERVDRYANDGFRVLGLASRSGKSETGLDWLGLATMLDPPRPEIPDAMARARAAGIRVLIITGDHPATAVAVARIAGMHADSVLTGDDFAAMTGPEREEAVGRTDVFARVSPADKLAIVNLLKARGEIVAVTGDGVNDAPALKRSDVGVAMGQRGSDVTREVADLVLLDDNFATIVAAIEEGRSIYENIQKFIRFLFSTNLSEVLVVSIGAFAAFLLGLRDAAGQLLLPLTAAQLLWINLVTDGAPALALGVDRNPGVMLHRPRDPASRLLDAPSLRFVLVTGSLKALVAFAILGLMPFVLGTEPDLTRTATFIFLAAGQLLFAYPARRTDLSPRPNLALHVAIITGFGAQALVLGVGPIREAFDAVPFTPAIMMWVTVSIVAAWSGAALVGRLIWRPPEGVRAKGAAPGSGVRAG